VVGGRLFTPRSRGAPRGGLAEVFSGDLDGSADVAQGTLVLSTLGDGRSNDSWDEDTDFLVNFFLLGLGDRLLVFFTDEVGLITG